MGYSAAIGRCLDVDSIVHRVDARVKAVSLIGFSMASFFVSDVSTGLVIGVAAISLIGAARVPWRMLWSTVRPFIALLAFSLAVNALVVKGGPVLGSFGPVSVTAYGLQAGIAVAYRTFAALVFGVLLVATTTPVALCDALERMLRPLGVFGMPYQDVAMIASIALRFVPLLSEEARQVVDAQKSRGAGALDRGVARRAGVYVSLAVPMLRSSLRHAQRLATALEGRCWAAKDTRTHLHEYRLHPIDAAFASGAVLFLVLFCAAAFAGPLPFVGIPWR